MGEGDVEDHSKVKRVEAGEVVLVPGSLPHYEGSDGDTILIGVATSPLQHPLSRETLRRIARNFKVLRSTDLLDGLFCDCGVQCLNEKYFASRSGRNRFIDSAVHSTKGRIAIVTDAGLDAMDAGCAFDEWR